MNKITVSSLIFLFSLVFMSYGQEEKKEKKVSVAFFDGTVIGGYVDRGVFLNFMGPNISLSKGSSRFVFGMLPSLRFKEDTGPTKNSIVTPNLGGGLTYSYKKIAFQVPFYYNTKTATRNGKWVVGFGMGYRFK